MSFLVNIVRFLILEGHIEIGRQEDRGEAVLMTYTNPDHITSIITTA